jgi:hypothetical protein
LFVHYKKRKKHKIHYKKVKKILKKSEIKFVDKIKAIEFLTKAYYDTPEENLQGLTIRFYDVFYKAYELLPKGEELPIQRCINLVNKEIRILFENRSKKSDVNEEDFVFVEEEGEESMNEEKTNLITRTKDFSDFTLTNIIPNNILNKISNKEQKVINFKENISLQKLRYYLSKDIASEQRKTLWFKILSISKENNYKENFIKVFSTYYDKEVNLNF